MNRKFFVCAGLLAVGCHGAMAQSSPRFHVKVSDNVPTSLITAPCVKPAESTGKLDLRVKNDVGGQVLVYTPRADDPEQFGMEVMTGETAPEVNGGCVAATSVFLSVIRHDGPKVPDQALGEAFNILVATFVLALLMESAFALLFNWRVFQEFLVGRSWRSIITFLVSLLVVRQFDLDLLASLFEAYHGTGGTVGRSWTTSILTAMIIAGGSAGVNRILVTLGFRSQVPKLEEQKEALLRRNLAYISVTLLGAAKEDQFRINAVPGACDSEEVMLGLIGNRGQGIWARLRGLFLANRDRFPPYGGHALDASLCYRITVTHQESGTVFDTDGSIVTDTMAARQLRFRPGAIVDFEIAVFRRL